MVDNKLDIPQPPIRPSAEQARGPGRPRLSREPVREDVVREPVRAEERLQRRRKRTENSFDLDPSLIPDGMSYEWKRASVFNKPDVQHMVALQDNHWRPVPASRHPHLMPSGQQSGNIEIDGLTLMERPRYLTEEAREEDYQQAREQVAIKEAQLGHTPDGTMTRKHGGAGARVKRSYEPLIVPKDE